jgi:hypothetical protein
MTIVGRRTAWRDERRLGLLLLAVAAGTNIPAPLLLIYRDQLAMAPTAVTALFGVYALGLVPAMVVAGPAADRWGRRRVAIPGAVLSAVASLSYVVAAESEPLLFAVRALQGAGAGAVFSVGSAWLVESAVRDGRATGARTTAVMMTGGFAIGPTAGGLIGEWGPLPLVLPYLLHAALVVIAVVVSGRVPETLAARPQTRRGPRPPPVRPGHLRQALLVVAPVAVCVYALPSTAINAVPVLVGFTAAPIALTGLLAGITLGSGALAAPLQSRLGWRTAPAAAVCGVVGFALTAAVATTPALQLLAVPAALVLGAGGGLALAGGLARLPSLASQGRLGTVSAAFYGFAYLGFATPLLLAGLSAVVTVTVPLLALAVTCALLSVQQARARL